MSPVVPKLRRFHAEDRGADRANLAVNRTTAKFEHECLECGLEEFLWLTDAASHASSAAASHASAAAASRYDKVSGNP